MRCWCQIIIFQFLLGASLSNDCHHAAETIVPCPGSGRTPGPSCLEGAVYDNQSKGIPNQRYSSPFRAHTSLAVRPSAGFLLPFKAGRVPGWGRTSPGLPALRFARGSSSRSGLLCARRAASPCTGSCPQVVAAAPDLLSPLSPPLALFLAAALGGAAGCRSHRRLVGQRPVPISLCFPERVCPALCSPAYTVRISAVFLWVTSFASVVKLVSVPQTFRGLFLSYLCS